MSYDALFDQFVREQLREATGKRLEMLQKDLLAEKKMFQEVLWPAFRTFKAFTMQFEIVTFTGVSIYIDAFYEPLGIAFESEGFVAHAENITRDRFDFERHRVRTLANKGYLYYPFTWDELSKRTDKCRTSLFELLGTLGAVEGEELSLYEQKVIAYAAYINKPIYLKDVQDCLKRGEDVSRKVLKNLQAKHRIKPLRTGKQRVHAYVLTDELGNRRGRNIYNRI
jgi:hypothetical protein